MKSLHRRPILGALALAFSAALLPALSHAQAWPAKPVKLIVPFPAGGGTDLAARIIGQQLTQQLGQPVIIDNKPGASTSIGVLAVTSAEPDGYTLLFSGSSSFTVNPAVRPKLTYDPFKQLSPIAMVARAPLVLVTSSSSPYKTMKDVIAKAKAKADPQAVTYSTFGAGSGPHLTGELLAYAAGIKLSPVPYKGSADAAIGVIRGDVGIGVDTIASANPHLQAGKLRALAVVSEKRSPLLPDVPAYGELGVSPAVFDAWYAVAGPAGLPAAVRDKLVASLTAVMADPEIRTKLGQQSMTPVLLGPQALREVMDAEITRYRAIVARANLQLD